MFGSNVQPKRRVRQAHKPWLCLCTEFPFQPGWLKTCPHCRHERPDQGA